MLWGCSGRHVPGAALTRPLPRRGPRRRGGHPLPPGWSRRSPTPGSPRGAPRPACTPQGQPSARLRPGGRTQKWTWGWSTAQGRWVCGNSCRRRARLSEAPTHGRLRDGGSARRTRRRQLSAGVRGARCSKRILDLTLSTEDGLIGVQPERKSRSIRVPKAATSPSASRHLGAQTVASWG